MRSRRPSLSRFSFVSSTSRTAGTLALAAALLGCSGGGASGGNTTTSSSGGGTGGGGGATPSGCDDYGGGDEMTPPVSFSKDVLPIFRNSCGFSSCHGNVSPTDPARHYFGPSNSDPAPDMTQIAAIFDQSVGKPAVEEPSLSVIEPGNPDRSFLMYKLDGTSCEPLPCAAKKTCGTSMPQGNPPLEEVKRGTIRLWIAQGAKND